MFIIRVANILANGNKDIKDEKIVDEIESELLKAVEIMWQKHSANIVYCNWKIEIHVE